MAFLALVPHRKYELPGTVMSSFVAIKLDMIWVSQIPFGPPIRQWHSLAFRSPSSPKAVPQTSHKPHFVDLVADPLPFGGLGSIRVTEVS